MEKYTIVGIAPLMKKTFFILIATIIIVCFCYFSFFNVDTSNTAKTYTLKLGQSVTFDGLYIENKGKGMWANARDGKTLPVLAPKLFIKPGNEKEGKEFQMAMLLYGNDVVMTEDEKKAETDRRKITAFGYELNLMSTNVYPSGGQELTFTIIKKKP